jgi:CheY-like chemotaxis protein
MHSGKLTGYSEGEGMGSEFRCELPALKLWKGASVGLGDLENTERDTENQDQSSVNIIGFLEFCAKQQILEEGYEVACGTPKMHNGSGSGSGIFGRVLSALSSSNPSTPMHGQEQGVTPVQELARTPTPTNAAAVGGPPASVSGGTSVSAPGPGPGPGASVVSVLGSMSTAAAAVAALGIQIPLHVVVNSTTVKDYSTDIRKGSGNAQSLEKETGDITPTIFGFDGTVGVKGPRDTFATVAQALATPTAKAAAAAARVGAKTVLVVDDAAPARKVLIRWLQNIGFRCIDAVDGQDCLDIIDALIAKQQNLLQQQEQEQEKPQLLAVRSDSTDIGITGSDGEHQSLLQQPVDFIFMDFEMPRLNGPKATLALRKRGITVPIIGVTGNVLPADTEYFINHGANAVLHKPLNLTRLALELKKYT